MADIHDYSTRGNKDTTIRIVRPRNHIGRAFGGDRIKIDSSELAHPAVAAALWSEEEAQAAVKALEERRARMFRDEPSPAQVAADKALGDAIERRRQQAERERLTAPIDAKAAEIDAPKSNRK